MRFYQGSAAIDVERGLHLSYRDADRGRLVRAIRRIRELRDDFPSNASIMYEEGVILRDYLGDGRAAFERFVAADRAGYRSSALQNALQLADSLETMELLEERSRQKLAEEGVDLFVEVRHRNSTEWGEFLRGLAAECNRRGQHGRVASICSILLSRPESLLGDSSHDGPTDQTLVEWHMTRAAALRELDRRATDARGAGGEAFPPGERLQLVEAVRAVDAGLLLDPYDVAMWNFKAAWCVMLERWDDVLIATDRALGSEEGTPTSRKYPKPFINRATALWRLGRGEEGVHAARESLAIAERIDSQPDIDLARRVIEAYRIPHHVPVENATCFYSGFIAAAHEETGLELTEARKWGNPNLLSQGIVAKMAGLPADSVVRLASHLAEVLAAFPSEFVFCILISQAAQQSGTVPRFIRAAVELVEEEESVVAQDAARVLLLWLVMGQSSDQGPASLAMIFGPVSEDSDRRSRLRAALVAEANSVDLPLADLLLPDPLPTSFDANAQLVLYPTSAISGAGSGTPASILWPLLVLGGLIVLVARHCG